ncbi:hypothetical protein [Paenochrobactrum pullorum]|uniref:hypothetical protein n=1 Tax=Paenochrobactrum pullorum TaxID=1324351 RepID=UPI0035BC8A1F
MTIPIRTDLIDVITPSRRGQIFYRRILQEAALNPQRWMRHHFIVIFDDDHGDNVKALLRWIEQARETMVLPRVTVTNMPAGDANILRQFGLALGDSPFVYFQDDDDPLPCHLDERIALMHDSPVDAVFGATETVTSRGIVVEQFPRIHDDSFTVDVLAGQAMFPSYGHPLAALFSRKMLERVPIDDGRSYHGGNGLPFNVRLMNAGVIITALPTVCRRVRLHTDNDNGIIERISAAELASDIRNWRDYIGCANVRAFHDTIAIGLEFGLISTFKEIATLVDIELGY